jgi:Phospholipid methyltransferase
MAHAAVPSAGSARGRQGRKATGPGLSTAGIRSGSDRRLVPGWRPRLNSLAVAQLGSEVCAHAHCQGRLFRCRLALSSYFSYVWCAREFYVTGRGTLAPSMPPGSQVASRPSYYRRSPMYVGVELVLLGWAILYWSAPLLLYAACVAGAFQLRVVLAERSRMALTFGAAWHERA